MDNRFWLLERFDQYASKKAIIDSDEAYTYADLSREIRSIKELLMKCSVNKGVVVAIVAEYSFRSIALLLALIENKNIIVPITTSVPLELEERLQEAFVDKKAVLSEERIEITDIEGKSEKHGLIRAIQSGGSSGLILFSSGITGKPKAMIHNLDALLEVYKSKKEKSVVILGLLMFDHIGGLNTLFSALSAGALFTIPSSRTAEYVCELIAKHHVDILPASPTFLNMILISESYKKYDMSSLKLITYGTEPMTETLLRRLKETFPRAKFLQTFGTSETGIAKTSSKSSHSTLLKIEDADTEFKIVDGELWLKSRTQVLGYLNAGMDNFTEDGWYKTGDLAEQTGDGYISIIGRRKEIINVGGQKVLPEEIENILMQIPQLADCLVRGERNIITGQMVVAEVVLKDGVDPKTVKSIIRSYCKDKLADYKQPARVVFVEKTNYGYRFKKNRIS